MGFFREEKKKCEKCEKRTGGNVALYLENEVLINHKNGLIDQVKCLTEKLKKAEYRGSNDFLNRIIQVKTNELRTEEEKNKELSEEIEQLKNRINTISKTCSPLQHQENIIDAQNRCIIDLNEQVNSLKAELSMTQDETDKLTTELNCTKETLKLEKSRFDERTLVDNNHLESLQAEVKHLREVRKNYRHLVEKKDQQIIDLKEELKAFFKQHYGADTIKTDSCNGLKRVHTWAISSNGNQICVHCQLEVKKGSVYKQHCEEDKVNKPSHYTDGKLEVIDILKDKLTSEEFKGFLKGNVLKYTFRAGKKDNEAEDLKKAQWYLDKMVCSIMLTRDEMNTYGRQQLAGIINKQYEGAQSTNRNGGMGIWPYA